MAFLDTSADAAPFPLDPDRNDAVGVAVSAVVPFAAAGVVQAMLATAGSVGGFAQAGLLIPDWLGPLAWLLMFPAFGVARWAAARSGDEGRAAGWWVVALIGWLLVLPVVAPTLDPFFVGWANLASLLLMVCAVARVAAVSRVAAAFMLPGLGLVTLGALPGYVLLTGGWTPGLAVTIGLTGSGD